MSIAAKCTCGKSYYCVGGEGCNMKFGDDIPLYSKKDYDHIKEGFLTTLKVLRTFMEKEELEHGLRKCDELIEQNSK